MVYWKEELPPLAWEFNIKTDENSKARKWMNDIIYTSILKEMKMPKEMLMPVEKRFVTVKCDTIEQACEIWDLAEKFGYVQHYEGATPKFSGSLYIALGTKQNKDCRSYDVRPFPQYGPEISYQEGKNYLMGKTQGETMKTTELPQHFYTCITNQIILDALLKIIEERTSNKLNITAFPCILYCARPQLPKECWGWVQEKGNMSFTYKKITLDQLIEHLNVPYNKPLEIQGKEVKEENGRIAIGCQSFTKTDLKELKRRLDNPIKVGGQKVSFMADSKDFSKISSVGTSEYKMTIDEFKTLCTKYLD